MFYWERAQKNPIYFLRQVNVCYRVGVSSRVQFLPQREYTIKRVVLIIDMLGKMCT